MEDFRLINHMHTAVAVIDRDMTVVEANDAFKQRSNLNKNINVIGTKCFNSAYNLSELCNSKLVGSCPVAESFETKKTSSTVHHVWVEDHAIVEEIITTPIVEKNGEVNFVVEEFRDLSQLLGLTKGIITICSYCRKIRDKDGQWLSFEAYLRKYTCANISHGICEECNEKIMKDFNKITHALTKPKLKAIDKRD